MLFHRSSKNLLMILCGDLLCLELCEWSWAQVSIQPTAPPRHSSFQGRIPVASRFLADISTIGGHITFDGGTHLFAMET